MEAKNLLEISDLLKSNTVGFFKTDFRSNLTSNEIDSWNDSSVSLELELFDRGNRILNLVLNWEEFEDMECAEDDEFKESVCIITGIESNVPQEMLEIKLYFPDSELGCGECFIFNYEETKEEDEGGTLQVPKSSTTNILSIDQFNNEDKKMERKRRRNFWLTTVGIVSLLVGYYFCEKNPETFKQIIDFFKAVFQF